MSFSPSLPFSSFPFCNIFINSLRISYSVFSQLSPASPLYQLFTFSSHPVPSKSNITFFFPLLLPTGPVLLSYSSDGASLVCGQLIRSHTIKENCSSFSQQLLNVKSFSDSTEVICFLSLLYAGMLSGCRLWTSWACHPNPDVFVSFMLSINCGSHNISTLFYSKTFKPCVEKYDINIWLRVEIHSFLFSVDWPIWDLWWSQKVISFSHYSHATIAPVGLSCQAVILVACKIHR